ncbi:hypothetical protein OG440_39970 (plasmid) [Streptomyces sp. NBC_00637]|uniref:hypothetical protein n=1 Tax=Streptomyces sp. NBC_00637 TaxID=2903667 RepID=UPI003246439D
MSPVLRLWAGVLLACALTLCLTGAARPAMTMSGPVRQAHQMDASGQAAQTVAGPAAGMEDHCPAGADHGARPMTAPASATLVVLGPAEGPRDAVSVRPWEERAGLSPPAEPAPPPDPNRLCVSRT